MDIERFLVKSKDQKEGKKPKKMKSPDKIPSSLLLPEWVETTSKEEFYLLLEELVRIQPMYAANKAYIRRLLENKASIDVTEISNRVGITKGEVLIILDQIRQKK